MNGPKTSAKRAEAVEGWTDEERAAMKEHAAELKKAAKGGKSADGEADILAKIAEMPESDRVMAERFHSLVKANAPMLTKAAMVDGKPEVGILPTGQAVGAIEELPTVAELLDSIERDARGALARACGGAS